MKRICQNLLWITFVALTFQAWADVPAVRSSNSGSLASTTSPAVVLATPIESGDLILVNYAVDAGQTVTWDNSTHGTWTAEITEDTNGFVGCHVQAKVADGTEDGGTLTLTLGVADTSKYTVYVFQTWQGSLANGLDSGITTPSSTSSPDPPDLNPSPWGTEDTLWIAGVCTDNNNAVSVWPTNYTSNQLEPNPSSQAVSIATAVRTVTSDESENPGAFTMTTVRASVPFTIAVRGTAASSNTPLRRRRAN